MKPKEKRKCLKFSLSTHPEAGGLMKLEDRHHFEPPLQLSTHPEAGGLMKHSAVSKGLIFSSYFQPTQRREG